MNDLEEILTKQTYLNSSRYISGRIIEYDIKSANISVLRNKNIISQERYEYLKNLPKINREIEIGLMEKNDINIYKEIQSGIIDSKIELVKFNKIDIDQIVRIANDAVYVNSDIDLKYTKFGEFIEFKQKSEYDVYCNLCNVLIFCKFLDSGNINIDIKGLDKTDRALTLHKDYMISVIISTIALLERSGIQFAIDYLSKICEKYIKKELDIGFYREFNTNSCYKLNLNMFETFGIDDVTNADKQFVDINYNYTILRELWSILLEIYELRKR